MTPSFSFSYNNQSFLIDGQPIQLFSGEVHYQRIPMEYWQHRLAMIRAMGLNSISVYMFWNQHELNPGEFNFEGINDVAHFIKLAQEAGLMVVLRPGPYCCAEWDFGGFPPWLLKDGNIRLRCMDDNYIAAVDRYMQRWAKELAPLQCTKGGPIVMVQVENEYGSYGNDTTYLGHIRDQLLKNGFEVPFFTCDGPGFDYLRGGTHPEVLSMVNFGNNPEKNFAILEKFRSNIPQMCCEYYPGWFNHWGDRHMKKTLPIRIKQIVGDLEWMATHNKSFSIYMVHGGTSFGFSAGANYQNGYVADVTSYDYSAPIDETGAPTDQYYQYRQMLAKYQREGMQLPPIPENIPRISIPDIHFTETAALYENLPPTIHAAQIHSMEYYGQKYGLINYSTEIISEFQGRTLRILKLHDYGYLFLNGKFWITVDHQKAKTDSFSLKIPFFEGTSAKLDILVEGHGRVNYGSHILDRKGIAEYVAVNEPNVLMNWEITNMPLDFSYLKALHYHENIPETAGPKIHRGIFTLTTIGDTFLDCRPYRKGMVWINGHNLGRFWEIGPQTHLYLPGCWLKQGENEIIVLDMLGPQSEKYLKKLNKTIWKQLPAESLKPMIVRPPIIGVSERI